MSGQQTPSANCVIIRNFKFLESICRGDCDLTLCTTWHQIVIACFLRKSIFLVGFRQSRCGEALFWSCSRSCTHLSVYSKIKDHKIAANVHGMIASTDSESGCVCQLSPCSSQRRQDHDSEACGSCNQRSTRKYAAGCLNCEITFDCFTSFCTGHSKFSSGRLISFFLGWRIPSWAHGRWRGSSPAATVRHSTLVVQSPEAAVHYMEGPLSTCRRAPITLDPRDSNPR